MAGMEISSVPFVAHNGLQIDETNNLVLPFTPNVENHLATVHAGAQFLLAESASGYYLLTAFPEYVGKVIPLLRQSTIKYRQQARGTLRSQVVLDDGAAEKFSYALSEKGRALIDLTVEVIDDAGELTCSASFRWFVQLAD